MRHARASFIVAAALAGCAHAPQVTSAKPPIGAKDPVARFSGAGGEDLALLAAACWMGGSWGDAVGEPQAARAKATEARCKAVLTRVYGDDTDHQKLLALRALERDAVNDVARHAAAREPDRAARADLRKLIEAVAAAERESMYARRAADRVKIDIERDRDERFESDQASAVAPLGARKALERLLALDAGRYSRDAHALGLLAAIDRVQLARGLPSPLKIAAVAPAAELTFAARAPSAESAPPGTWARYLRAIAAASGHPVDATGDSRARNQRAWRAMREGFADRLADASSGLAPELAPAVRGAIRILRS